MCSKASPVERRRRKLTDNERVASFSMRLPSKPNEMILAVVSNAHVHVRECMSTAQALNTK